MKNKNVLSPPPPQIKKNRDFLYNYCLLFVDVEGNNSNIRSKSDTGSSFSHRAYGEK